MLLQKNVIQPKKEKMTKIIKFNALDLEGVHAKIISIKIVIHTFTNVEIGYKIKLQLD